MKKTLDWNEYIQAACEANAEGCVLLENREHILPLAKGTAVSIFGRIQDHYYKSGTGSGGMVNVARVYSIPDGIRENGDLVINEELHDIYVNWENVHPYDEGTGWGEEPWSQVEMELTDEQVAAASEKSDVAIVIIGRTAGEDRDAADAPGSYRLTDIEKDMLRKVRRGFSKMIVLLNVGAIIDMSWMDEINPEAVMYVWQGGMVGGLAVADMLVGKLAPSGKLSDTIAYRIEDYPSDREFGGEEYNCYAEDIYVGYRYFETFAKDKVRYPFGYGLSYTDFEITYTDVRREAVPAECASGDGLGRTVITADVKNVGEYAGKEVIQIYGNAPQGVLGKPSRVLLAYAKTELLAPGETETIVLTIDDSQLESYDDSGVTGHKACFLLEAGEYCIYGGTNVRNAEQIAVFELENPVITQKCQSALGPVRAYQRMKPGYKAEQEMTEQEDRNNGGGHAAIAWEDVPCAELLPEDRRNRELPEEYPQRVVSDEILGLNDKRTTGSFYRLEDVLHGVTDMETFVAQLSDEDLACIVRGEGMGSSLVTAGTASAYGGVSKRLRAFGIPAVCCDDGPSGMRLDSGAKAFSLPNGTLIGCSFNPDMVEKLYEFLGLEMISNKVDNLLGPGMNIHRHPLNGRNFEYFSEDPYLTGTLGTAQVRGLQNAGVTGTIKHFAGNNQEFRRHFFDSVISERALREIYLKGFEMVVRSGVANSIMTTYGMLNGLYTSGQYDLNTTILRGEWGYTGIVMSDWWADINERNQPQNKTNFAAMVRSQNDLYMVCPDGSTNASGDNTLEALVAGKVTRGELQRSAMNVCRAAMQSEAMRRLMGEATEVEIINRPKYADDFDVENVEFITLTGELTVDLTYQEAKADMNYLIALDVQKFGIYNVTLVGSSELNELAQLPCTLFCTGIPLASYTFHGTGGDNAEISHEVFMPNRFATMRLYVAKNGLKLKEIRFKYQGELPQDYFFGKVD